MAEEPPPSSSSSTSPASSATGRLLNIPEIFRVAIKVSARNEKLMLQIMLLVLSPFTILVLLHRLFAVPLMEEVEDGYGKSMVDQGDLRALLGREAPFLAGFWAVSVFGMIITVYASSMAYTSKSVSLKVLLSCIQWKKPIITSLYPSFTSFMYAVLVIVLIRSINLIAQEGAGSSWRVLMAILAVLVYLYLATVATLGLVVSIMEEECYGVKALEKAVNLSRGRRFQGFCLMLILELLTIPIYVLFYVTSTDDDDEIGSVILLGFGFIASVLCCLANMFTYVVFSVFYYECKKTDSVGKEMELGPGYRLVPMKPEEKEGA